MEKVKLYTGNMFWVIKALLSAYATTAIALLILAFGLYKFDLTEQTVQGGIIAIYVLSAFIGGRVAGKMMKIRRFLWGALAGFGYFAMLMLISFLVYHSAQAGTGSIVDLALCILGGTLGGMTS